MVVEWARRVSLLAVAVRMIRAVDEARMMAVRGDPGSTVEVGTVRGRARAVAHEETGMRAVELEPGSRSTGVEEIVPTVVLA